MKQLTKNPVALGVAGLGGVAVLLLLLKSQGSGGSNYAVLLPSPVQGGGIGSLEPGPTTPAPKPTTPKPTTPKPRTPTDDTPRSPVPLPSVIPDKLAGQIDAFRRRLVLPGQSRTKPPATTPAPVAPNASLGAPLDSLPRSLKPLLDLADDLSDGLSHIMPLEPGQGQQVDTAGGFGDLDPIEAIKPIVTPVKGSITSITPTIPNVTQPIKAALGSVKNAATGR